MYCQYICIYVYVYNYIYMYIIYVKDVYSEVVQKSGSIYIYIIHIYIYINTYMVLSEMSFVGVFSTCYHVLHHHLVIFWNFSFEPSKRRIEVM